MNSERTQAYGRVVKTLTEIGPTKLQPSEQERIREAADTLVFSVDAEESRAALDDVRDLCDSLVDSGRWLRERADDLLADLEATGPALPV
jgi:predicted dinucleotide-binding enzyme